MSDDPGALGYLVWFHVEEICNSTVFKGRTVTAKLLKYLVLQSLHLKTVTETDIDDFLRANPGTKTKRAVKNGKREGLREEVATVREKLAGSYESNESATALFRISIPNAGIEKAGYGSAATTVPLLYLIRR